MNDLLVACACLCPFIGVALLFLDDVVSWWEHGKRGGDA